MNSRRGLEPSFKIISVEDPDISEDLLSTPGIRPGSRIRPAPWCHEDKARILRYDTVWIPAALLVVCIGFGLRLATDAKLEVQRSAWQVGGSRRVSATVPPRCRDTLARADGNICNARSGCEQPPHKFRKLGLRIACIRPLTQLATVDQFRPDRATLRLNRQHRTPALPPKTLYIPRIEAVKPRPGNPSRRKDPLTCPVANRIFMHAEPTGR